MKKIFTFGSLGLLLAPAVAMAQNVGYVDFWVNNIQYYLTRAITIIMVVMTLWFLWSVFKFIGEKDPTKMKDRKKQMFNGLIGLFIAVAVWGIIRIAGRILGVDTVNTSNYQPGLTCPPGTEFISSSRTCR